MPLLTSGRSRFLGGGRVPPTPVPVAGAELVVNGNFSAWTGDNPDGWTVETEDAGNYVTQNPAGVANLVIDNTKFFYLQQTPPTNVGDWSIRQFDVLSITGKFNFDAQYGGVVATLIEAPGTYYRSVRRLSNPPDFLFYRAVGFTCSAGIDNVSCKKLTLASLLSTKLYASPDCDISAAVTRTAGTQAGFAVRVDDPANPQNFIISYLDGAGNLKTDKCVAGTYSNIAGCSGAVAYVAGQRPRIVCSGNNVSVYYNGTQVGSTTAITDAGIVSNKNHGLFSTYAANTFSGYVAA